MTTNSSNTGNPFFDAWWAGSEQVLRAQTEWFSMTPDMNDPSNTEAFFDSTKHNWEKCEQQFQAWSSAVAEWFEQVDDNQQGTDYSSSFDALKSMLSPSAFLNSGIAELDLVFQRLAEGPDFADFGVFEKKWLRINNDLNSMRIASAEYQTVISRAWLEAFQTFTSELVEDQKTQALPPKDLLQRWMDTANHLLVDMQRSEDFLTAQRNLLTASTEYKLKQKEIIEVWCESMTMPTRTEVDDLHQIVYQLRRELRDLKKQITEKNTSQKKADSAVNLNIVETQPKAKKETTAKEHPKKATTKKATTKKVATKKASTKKSQPKSKQVTAKKVQVKKTPVRKKTVVTNLNTAKTTKSVKKASSQKNIDKRNAPNKVKELKKVKANKSASKEIS